MSHTSLSANPLYRKPSTSYITPVNTHSYTKALQHIFKDTIFTNNKDFSHLALNQPLAALEMKSGIPEPNP